MNLLNKVYFGIIIIRNFATIYPTGVIDPQTLINPAALITAEILAALMSEATAADFFIRRPLFLDIDMSIEGTDL